MNKHLRVGLVGLLVLGLIVPTTGAALAQRTVERRVGALKAAPDHVFVADDALYRRYQSGALTDAEYALERARSVFALKQVRARYGSVARPESHAVTLILRDLAARLHELSGSQRSAAKAILARPTTPGGEGSFPDYGATPAESTCTATFCVHWVESGPHAVALADADGNGIPDWVDGVVETYEYVVGSFAGGLGYTPVKSDLTSADNGGNALPDVYLVDIGDDPGYYGYCTSDDPNLEDLGGTYAFWDMSGYCVIDEDFSIDQFPTNTPVGNMQVTAAHEFFHAVQFGYDMFDDTFFLESTAAWVEDVLYDDIDDNYEYLRNSAITYPDIPLDYTDSTDFFYHRYGGWLWFRFLTESFGDGTNHDVDIVREMWERAAAREGHPTDVDDYSVLAMENVLAARGADFAEMFGDFNALNWFVELTYEEGAEYYDYLLSKGADPRPYLLKTHNVSSGKPKTGSWQYKSLHLSTANIAFYPKRGVKSNARLLLKVNGPNTNTSPEARYVIFYKSGQPGWGAVSLDGSGDGKKRVAFGKGTVTAVILALTNASTRYSCWQNTFLACQGIAWDDDAKFVWSGALKQ